MIEFCDGDIFEADVEALVNPVNCVGVAGKGLAKEFGDRFPENLHWYKRACACDTLSLGHIHVGQLDGPAGRKRRIVNFPTKNDWRDVSYLGPISRALDELVAWVKEWNIKSIAIPALGCGLGGLRWDDEVRPMIEGAFAALPDVRVILYPPH